MELTAAQVLALTQIRRGEAEKIPAVGGGYGRRRTVAAWPDTGPRRDGRRKPLQPLVLAGAPLSLQPPVLAGAPQLRRAAEGKGREGGGDGLGVHHRAVIEHPEVPEGMTLGVEQGYPHIAPHPRLRHPGVGRKALRQAVGVDAVLALPQPFAGRAAGVVAAAAA